MARISVRGIVQGVGLRPFVYQTAVRYNLRGWVCNTSEDVRIEIEGEAADIDRFLDELRNNPPPLSLIESMEVTAASPDGHTNFEIRESIPEAGKYQLVSPDLATCDDCRREIFDPADRRYRYPFTNCTNCGPRFTIITDIPYDRPNTTMQKFTMCPACRKSTKTRSTGGSTPSRTPARCAGRSWSFWIVRGRQSVSTILRINPP
jgi:hydrogenase maturation protein HypF